METLSKDVFAVYKIWNLNSFFFSFEQYSFREPPTSVTLARHQSWHVTHAPVVTGRKLNVHKTFRKRPGRLLNVLFTFHLRSMSMGEPR